MYSRLQNSGWHRLHNRLALSTRQSSGGILKKKESVTKLQPGKSSHGFTCSEVEHVKEYNMTAYFLTHEKTKTEYLHLERDDSNNVFSVGFRTTPLDSMGTPHILEHTVLCGSEKYPVRDPFFKMLNRSLATFMNALTGPDYTFYPFSSQNEVDYRNLQKVYLDAVFKPNLSRLDFLQEGWRLEHKDLKDTSSELVFKGVVYNEMKGAFSETSSLFGQKFINAILPQGTYGYVSGGDPLHIPNLTHEHLTQFHASCYHPSNARIYSYGNFPLEQNLKFLNEAYLSKYSYLDPANTVVTPQGRWEEMKRAEISCRLDQFGGPIEKQNQIAIGYVMSDITNIYETFMLTALAELMIIGPNSAFYKSLIEKNISGGYNSLTGYDNQIRDTLFVVGLRDIEKEKFSVVEKIVNQTLEELHHKGFEKDHIESVLHGFELSIKHQSPKFGLNLLFNLMPLWNHSGPILNALKVNELLQQLKSNLLNPSYMKEVIEKYFIQNKHKLIMTMQPDPQFDDVFNTAESKLLQTKVKKLSKEEKEKIYEEGLELSAAQKKQESLESLPCLKIDEITLNKTAPALTHTVFGTIPLQMCEANTNGVTYFKGVLGTDCLNESQRLLLPFFKYALDKFDTKSYNYRDFDKYISKSTSGLSILTHITEHIDLQGQYEQGILVSSHCLDDNVPKMLDIWSEIFKKPNFENSSRMGMLLNNYCSSLTSGVVDSGHTYAMQAARALVSPVDECKESLLGLQHVINMQDVQKNYTIEKIQKVINEISDQVLKGHNLRAAFHYLNTNTKIQKHVEDFCINLCKDDKHKDINRINWTDCAVIPKENRGVHISMNIPVNFCAKVIPTVAYTDSDYAKLRVLSRFLTSKYLHPIVREQNGAYGGGAMLTIDGIFNFYSYRDPNTRLTMDVFDNTSDWMTKNANLVDDQNLFEAKLSILQQMDQPIAEYMKGIDLFLYGLSYDIWKTQRERVLAVKNEDLVEVCQKYLSSDKWAGKCVIGDGASQKLEKENEAWAKCQYFCATQYNFPNTDILVNNILDQLEIDDLKNTDFFKSDFDLKAIAEKNGFLSNFFAKLDKFKINYDEFVEDNDLESKADVPLSPKKRHEIVYLTKEITDVCNECGCDTVVDFGSGLGYLDQFVFETTNYNVLGLECNESHYVGAKKRQRKYHLNSIDNVKYIKHFIRDNSDQNIIEYLRDKFENHEGICITGLHACADLTVDAVNLFLKMADAKAMILMPCCYHKMRHEDQRFDNFPLSDCSKEFYEKYQGYEFLRIPFLRLAAQPPCRSDDSLEGAVFNLLSRAVLQLYARGHNLRLKRNKRKAVKTKILNNDFSSYIQDAVNGFNLVKNSEINEEENNIRIEFDQEELSTIWREMSNDVTLKKAGMLILLQNYLQPVIENFVLYDRITYLKEKGLENCRFKKIFDSKISPRCLALVAFKQLQRNKI